MTDVSAEACAAADFRDRQRARLQPRHDADLQPVPELHVLLGLCSLCIVQHQPPTVHRAVVLAIRSVLCLGVRVPGVLPLTPPAHYFAQ